MTELEKLKQQLAKASERVKDLEAHNKLLMEVSWEMKEGKPDAFYKIKDARNTQASDALKKIAIEQKITGIQSLASYIQRVCGREYSIQSIAESMIKQLRKEQE
jgi:hypothetical protein